MEKIREEFIVAVKESGNLSRTCRDFDITRRTGYKLMERAATGQGLHDQNRAPSNIPNKTPAHIEALIVSLRKENPAWGGKTIREVLIREGWQNLPCVKTCNNILKRNDCIDPIQGLKHKPVQRFVREKCNELWQTDFKGDFALLDCSRCYPLTILDDNSRFSIMIDPKPEAKGVKDSFRQAFLAYGMPESVLSDNGGQFRGFNGGYTQFERWLMDSNVLPIHGRPWHPQTQGKIERFHRTMNQELLKHHTFADLADVTAQLQSWREKYNNIRPHEALGMKTPAEIYVPSNREYRDTPPKIEYGGQFPVRKVNNWGYLRFEPNRVYLSETMADTHLEIRPGHNDTFCVCYRNFKIARIDAHTGTLLNRKIYRL